MLRLTLTAVPVILLCLLLQAAFVAKCLRFYVKFQQVHLQQTSYWHDLALLSAVMLLTLVGNSIQIAIWAALFMMLGEFDDLATALYHSGVNFATLGYGDIVMSERWRLLGPLEAANGILMFGVSTAVMTAAVMDVIKRNLVSHNAPR